MSQTRDQQRFTISEVEADWQSQWCRSAAHYVAIHCPHYVAIHCPGIFLSGLAPSTQ